jgi:hypothetical protein
MNALRDGGRLPLMPSSEAVSKDHSTNTLALQGSSGPGTPSVGTPARPHDREAAEPSPPLTTPTMRDLHILCEV